MEKGEEVQNMRYDREQAKTLPDHLILDHILPRLPVKSLIQFKSVSKMWYSHISSAEFAKSHLQFSSSCHHFLIYKYDGWPFGESFLLSYDEHDLKELVGLDDKRFDGIGGTVILMGSHNGLVCLDYEEYCVGFFILWNPAIHQFRIINNPNQGRSIFYGFGYASQIDDYKLVYALRNGHGMNTDLHIFSLRTGKWTKVACLEDDYGIILEMALCSRGGLLLDDNLYWFSIQPNVKHIFRFDLVREQFEAIPMMDWASSYRDGCLYVMKGYLSLHCHCRQSSDVWILKEHGNWQSWEKLFSIPPTMQLMGFSTTSKVLVHQSSIQELMLIDPSQEALENFQGTYCCSDTTNITLHYVESLISPFGSPKFNEVESLISPFGSPIFDEDDIWCQ